MRCRGCKDILVMNLLLAQMTIQSFLPSALVFVEKMLLSFRLSSPTPEPSRSLIELSLSLWFRCAGHSRTTRGVHRLRSVFIVSSVLLDYCCCELCDGWQTLGSV